MCTDCLALEVTEAASDSPADSEIRSKQQNKQNASRVSVVQVSFNACVFFFGFCSCYKVLFTELADLLGNLLFDQPLSWLLAVLCFEWGTVFVFHPVPCVSPWLLTYPYPSLLT